MGALDSPSFPVRPVDEFGLEDFDSFVDFEYCAYRRRYNRLEAFYWIMFLVCGMLKIVYEVKLLDS